MTTDWDERTEAIPGTKGDKSFELDLEFQVELDAPLLDESRSEELPSIVVFEPAPIGLADALSAMGYAVRTGTTGVDVMSVVAANPPALVVCAPAPDAERRRLLSAALRLRFPSIPVVYVSVHAAQEEAVLGAIREGARAVLAWPLPDKDAVGRALAPFVRAAPSDTVAQNTHAGGASFADDDDDSSDTDERKTRPVVRPPPIPSSASSPGFAGVHPDMSELPTSTSWPHKIDSDIVHESPTAPARKPAPPSLQQQPPPPKMSPKTPAKARDDDDIDPEFDNARTAVMPSQQSLARQAPPPSIGSTPRGPTASRRAQTTPNPPAGKGTVSSPAELPDDALKPLPVPLPVMPRGYSAIESAVQSETVPQPHQRGQRIYDPTTEPNPRAKGPGGGGGDIERRGEIGELLTAVSPFLWSLEDAARWAEHLGARGDPIAKTHARTLTLLAKILAQLQARIDEVGV